MKKGILFSAMMIMLSFVFTSNVTAQTQDADVTIIELHQTPGAFKTTNLNLLPGKYQFRVVNDDVEKEVGFLIQQAAKKDMNPMETAVDNSFTTKTMKKGEVAYTGVVELTAGEYVYSCPMNPTPHYTINVKK
ncbi:hypothetical protein N9B82_05545 [Saprospiraceae bacterium]|nr:hypothetical protein [Saprospiraceae bacterium]